MIDLFQKGGIVMYPILFLSIIALAVFLERMITLRKNKFVPKVFEEQLIFLLKQRSIKEAADLCRDNGSPLANVSYTIISNIDLPLTRLLEVAEEAGRAESIKLEKYLQTMQTIVALSPLLGLLGTVFGMITIFNVIALKGSGHAQDLSAGIAEALITTAAGLIVAIPTQIFYHITRARADVISNDLERAASRVMNLLFKEEA